MLLRVGNATGMHSRSTDRNWGECETGRQAWPVDAECGCSALSSLRLRPVEHVLWQHAQGLTCTDRIGATSKTTWNSHRFVFEHLQS